MIHSLDIRKPADVPVKWLSEVAALKEPRKFDFKPGLNILWGQNGSGKTTVLKLMSMLFHCEQGGVPFLTQTSVSALCDRMSFGDKLTRGRLLASVKINHDGQGVRLIDPSKAIGMAGSSFDEDFFGAGLKNLMFKGSAGQTTMRRLSPMIADCREEKPAPQVGANINRDHVNSLWQEWIDVAQEWLKGNSEKGPATILMDEPERSFDLPLQALCWRFLRAESKSHQIIVASHSVFALNIPEANYIEMEPGYLEGAQKAVGLLSTWADEKPEPLPRVKAEEPKPKTPKTKNR